MALLAPRALGEGAGFGAGLGGGALQLGAEDVTLFVNGGDDKPGWYTKSYQGGLRQLEARFDILWHGVRDAKLIEFAGVFGISGPCDNHKLGVGRA